jgi:D-alanyl-lipoteichoic acid acyltransferase DltB (MBOAT superfamily)
LLFNSLLFVFGFLPVTLAVTYCLGRRHQTAAKLALILVSLAFYAYWRVQQLPLLLFSIGFNFVLGSFILRAEKAERTGLVRGLLAFGILVDLSLLGWFKYANFVVDNLDWAFGLRLRLAHIALPLAISFFTFQKLAYLIDTARGETRRVSLLDFSLFAAFFPQLIAGPIVHFREVMPQLQTRRFARLIGRNLLVGLVIFAIGLFKKTVIADTLADFVNPLYAKNGGTHYGLLAGWLAASGFTFQVYFDFSAYSDMAIGLGRMLGVKLPLNFHSPLRAASIIDYWRRWHMTLQRFVMAYIFQPLSLSLNRWAAAMGLEGWPLFAAGIGAPVFVTFVAVGLWHGAGWTFVLYGVMQGIYLCVNEAWRERARATARARRRSSQAPASNQTAPAPWIPLIYQALTLIAVMYSNVMFRAISPAQAFEIWKGMSGAFGTGALGPVADLGWGFAVTLLACVLVVFLAPNTQQIMGLFDPALNWREWRDVARAPLAWTWRPSPAGVAFAAVALFMGVMFIQKGRAVFIYFNF